MSKILETEEDVEIYAHHMTIGRYFILKRMSAGPMTMGEMALVGKFSAASATGQRDGLIKAGLIAEASSSPDDPPARRDRRKVYIEITPVGRKVVAEFEKLMKKVNNADE
jgi:DNA-binding MarR family transcriptional regulator